MNTLRSQNGFSLLEMLVVLALIGMLVLGFGSSMVKNLQARKAVEAKLGYQEISGSVRSALGQILRNPPATGCLGFAPLQTATAASSLLSIESKVSQGLSTKNIELLATPKHNFIRSATERCTHPKDISDPGNAADNNLFLCARFKTQTDADSVFLSSPHAFGEYRLEFINSQSNQPISCNDYRLSKQAGVNVYYSIYWLSGKGSDPTYSKHTGYYYVGK